MMGNKPFDHSLIEFSVFNALPMPRPPIRSFQDIAWSKVRRPGQAGPGVALGRSRLPGVQPPQLGFLLAALLGGGGGRVLVGGGSSGQTRPHRP